MSNRARQLLLEILLLSEKYADSEIAWVRSQLLDHKKGAAVLELVYSARPKPNDKSPAVNVAQERRRVETTPLMKKSLFLETLLRNKTNQDFRRAEKIAERLQISLKGQSHEELVAEIGKRLESLSSKHLDEFLRPYKIGPKTDDAYIGLADAIMKTEVK